MSHSGRKTANEKLLMALAVGGTVEQAAQAAGVSRRTAHRRLRDPDFLRRLRQTKRDLSQRTADMLCGACGEAVKTLVALLREPAPFAVRLGAARAIVELSMKTREAGELEERLNDLEDRVGGKPRMRVVGGRRS
jgi:hypothetical protein